MENYLKASIILDYHNAKLQTLIVEKKWQLLPIIDRVKAIYNFVRDEIKFGYNLADDIPASQVYTDGYGQCNTKATLLMALLRAVKIPNRIHGFTIDKALQKGAITGIWYTLSPKNILHSWVEVFITGEWYFLEGVILDSDYLQQLQILQKDNCATFCGYGAYTDNLKNPPIEWNLNHTYIQHKGINQDFGVFDTPDDFYAVYHQELNFIQKIVYKFLVRHIMNYNVQKIRQTKTHLS